MPDRRRITIRWQSGGGLCGFPGHPGPGGPAPGAKPGVSFRGWYLPAV